MTTDEAHENQHSRVILGMTVMDDVDHAGGVVATTTVIG